MMKYCKNCEHENDKNCNYTIKIHSEIWGDLEHSVSGCGREQIKFKEDKKGYSFIPYRNEHKNCPYYTPKWWKFWIK